MIGAVRYIIPEVQYEARRASAHRPFYLEWHTEYNLAQIVPPPPKERLEHDPEWRNRFLSIQGAHDRTHWVWKAAYVVAKVGPILWF